MATVSASTFFQQCAKSDDLCENSFTECFTRENSECYVSQQMLDLHVYMQPVQFHVSCIILNAATYNYYRGRCIKFTTIIAKLNKPFMN